MRGPHPPGWLACRPECPCCSSRRPSSVVHPSRGAPCRPRSSMSQPHGATHHQPCVRVRCVCVRVRLWGVCRRLLGWGVRGWRGRARRRAHKMQVHATTGRVCKCVTHTHTITHQQVAANQTTFTPPFPHSPPSPNLTTTSAPPTNSPACIKVDPVLCHATVCVLVAVDVDADGTTGGCTAPVTQAGGEVLHVPVGWLVGWLVCTRRVRK